MKILFVCLGNICRSPLAEGLFQWHAQQQGLADRFTVDSCGTNGLHNGELPDTRTRKNALSHGLQLEHRSRQIQQQDFAEFDRILVMDEQNVTTVKNLCPEAFRYKIHKMRELDPIAPHADVQDPWYGGEEGFETTFQTLDRCAKAWLFHLVSNVDN